MRLFRLTFQNCSGFTLAELLIALMILGVIVSFTVPKVVNSQQTTTRKAIFKETIAAISTVAYQGLLVEPTTVRTNIKTYMTDHLNAIKICTTDAVTEGCWGSPTYSTYNDTNAVLLANGASISDIDFGACASGACTDALSIDWNGPDLPNTQGQDRLIVKISYGPTPSAGTIAARVYPYGALDSGASDTLWEEIFQ